MAITLEFSFTFTYRDKTMKNGILFGLLLSLFGASAFASEWNNFTTANNHDHEYFFDAASVEKSKDVSTVWIKTVRTYTPDSDGSWATALRWRLNCQKKTIQTLAWSTYDADGKFIKSGSNASSEDAAIPDSIGEGILKASCMADFPKNTPATNPVYFKLDKFNNDIFAATKRFVELRKSRVDNAPN
jgi:hypothetical protein